MRDLVDRLYYHISDLFEHLGLDRMTFESEGLGLRPLASIRDTSESQCSVLARRYYRLAQWTETIQGSYWLTVRSPKGVVGILG